MNKIFFTSDLHFCHNRDFLYSPRGFDNIEEMNQAIVHNWNRTVGKEDAVYVLGDLVLNDNVQGLEFLKQLNGNLYIALGNHDTDGRIELYRQCHNIQDVQFMYRLKAGKKTLLLSHYPQLVANAGQDKPVWNLHGHTHSKDRWSENYHCYNVNMDAHNCTPVSLEEILKDFQKYNEAR